MLSFCRNFIKNRLSFSITRKILKHVFKHILRVPILIALLPAILIVIGGIFLFIFLGKGALLKRFKGKKPSCCEGKPEEAPEMISPTEEV